MNDDQDNSQLALVRSLHEGLIELKAEAERQATIAERLLEAIKWHWKKLSPQLRLGVDELTEEKIAELYDTYNERTRHLENERLTQIHDSKEMASKPLAKHWSEKDLAALESSESLTLPINVQLILDAGECMWQMGLTAERLSSTDNHILSIGNCLAGADKPNMSIVYTSTKEDGSTSDVPFEKSALFKELNDFLRDGRKLLDDREPFLTSPERMQKISRFERELRNSLQQIVAAQAREIRNHVLAHEYELAHLYDENLLRQRLGPLGGVLDRVETLLHDRMERLPESDLELLAAQWSARVWGALSNSLSSDATGAEDHLLISTRTKSLFGLMNEDSPGPPSWQNEAMVMLTNPLPEGHQIPDQAMLNVFQSECDDAALNVYERLLHLRQSLIASKANNEDQQWVESRLEFTWEQLGESAREQITSWAKETTPGKDEASALQYLRDHPIFPQVLQLHIKWGEKSALSPQDLERMHHDTKILEQQLIAGSSALQVLDQSLEKIGKQTEQMPDLKNTILASASESCASDILRDVLKLSHRIKELQQAAEQRHIAVQQSLSLDNPLVPQNSQEMQDRFLRLLKADRRMLDESEELLSKQASSEKDLEKVIHQQSLFEKTYGQKKMAEEIGLLLKYFENEGVDVQRHKKKYEAVRDKISDNMLPGGMGVNGVYGLTKVDLDSSSEEWDSHMDDMGKRAGVVDDELHSLAVDIGLLPVNRAKLNDFILETLKDRVTVRSKEWNATQSAQDLKSLEDDLKWIDSIGTERLQALPKATRRMLDIHQAYILIAINEYSQFETLLKRIDEFNRQENSSGRGKLVKAGELMAGLESLRNDSRDERRKVRQETSEALKAQMKWLNQLAEYQRWGNENNERISKALNSITNGYNKDNLQKVAERLKDFIHKAKAEYTIAATEKYFFSFEKGEVQRQMEREARELNRQIKAYSQSIDEPDPTDKEKFLLAIVDRMYGDLIADGRAPHLILTPNQNAVAQWSRQYKPAVTNKYIAKKAKPDAWSQGPLSVFRGEETRQDKAVKRAAFTLLLKPKNNALVGKAASPQAEKDQPPMIGGENRDELSGQSAVTSGPSADFGNKLDKQADHGAISNEQRTEYLEEFSIVLQAALRAARNLASKDTRVHRRNPYVDRTKFNFFIAEQCCKELIRSEHLNTFFSRWAAAKAHDDSPIEKMVIAASAVINIIDILKKTRQDTIRGVTRDLVSTASLLGTLGTASFVLEDIMGFGDKRTLHPSIREQFKSLKTDFVEAVPPAGLSWGVPEYVTDLTKLQNVTMIRCRVSPIFTTHVAPGYHGKDEVHKHVRDAARALHNNGQPLPEGANSEATDSAARADALAKEQLLNVINKDVVHLQRIISDKKGKGKDVSDGRLGVIDRHDWQSALLPGIFCGFIAAKKS